MNSERHYHTTRDQHQQQQQQIIQVQWHYFDIALLYTPRCIV